MPIPLAGLAIGSFAASAFDSIGKAKSARKASRKQDRYIERADGRLHEAETLFDDEQPLAQGFFRGALDDAQATRSRVLSYADAGFRQEIERVMRSRDQAKARATQDMIGRGLFSSTAATSRQRGIDSDASRIAGEVGASFAQRRAGIDLQASGNVQNAMSQLGNLIRAQTQDKVANKMAQANLWAGAPVVATPHPLSTAGQLVGHGVSAYQGYAQARQDEELLKAIQGLSGTPGGQS